MPTLDEILKAQQDLEQSPDAQTPEFSQGRAVLAGISGIGREGGPLAAMSKARQSFQAPAKEQLAAKRTSLENQASSAMNSYKAKAAEMDTRMGDPKSAESQAAQKGVMQKLITFGQFVKKPIPETYLKTLTSKSAKELKDLKDTDEFIDIFKLMKQEEEKANTVDTKETQADEKVLNDTIDTLAGLRRGSNAGVYGMAAKRVALAADGLRLIDNIKAGKIVPDQSVLAEQARNLDSLLSNNQGSAAMTHDLIQKTGKSTLAGALEFLFSTPFSATNASLLKNVEEQVKGQRDFWRGERDKTLGSQKIKLEGVFSRDKSGEMSDRFDRAAAAVFETPEAHPQDSEAVQWAKANPKDPRAAQILKINGAK